MKAKVILSKLAQKQILKVPSFIQEKFQLWIDKVKNEGLDDARKIKGFNDEALKGNRKGQRSVRLNQAYRAIYEVHKNGDLIILVLEVNKHEY